MDRERIFAFPVQQQLGEWAKVLRYMYVTYRVNKSANVRVTLRRVRITIVAVEKQ